MAQAGLEFKPMVWTNHTKGRAALLRSLFGVPASAGPG